MNPESAVLPHLHHRLITATLGGLVVLMPPMVVLIWLCSLDAARRPLLLALLVWLGMVGVVIGLALHRLLRTRETLRQERVLLEQHERELQAAMQRYRQTLDAVPAGMLLADGDGRIVMINSHLLQMFGHDADELLGRPVECLLPERARARHPQQRRGFMSSPQTRMMGAGLDLRGRRKDGSEFPVEVGLSHFSSDGQARVLATVVDVTLRQQLAQAEQVAERERFIRRLADQLPGLVGYWDAGQHCRFANRVYQEWFGIDPDTIIGRHSRDVLGDELYQRNLPYIQGALAGQPQRFERTFTTPAGHTLHTQAHFIPDESGGVIRGYFVQVTDVTELRRREDELTRLKADLETLVEQRTSELRQRADELQRSNTALEQFAYAASHDLQEPLRMVTSYTQLIERRYNHLLDDSGRQMMHYVVDAARRMRALINDLLTYARAGTSPARPHADMAQACQTALALLQGQIEREHARIEIIDPLPAVQADQAAMAQLWQNLIGNALRYRSAAAPLVRIQVRDHGSTQATFCISDNGVGIAPQYQARIFLLFQRLETDPARRHEGTGIGLALCKRIVETCGGKIWVESDGLHGSTFCFTLPLSTDPTASSPTSASEA